MEISAVQDSLGLQGHLFCFSIDDAVSVCLIVPRERMLYVISLLKKEKHSSHEDSGMNL